jgi:hypothetical protein
MLPSELRRSCGLLPGTELLCTSLCSGVLCSGCLCSSMCSDLLCSCCSDLLRAFSVQHERVLPSRSELLRPGCSGMLCSRCLCSGVRHWLRSDLPQRRLLQAEAKGLLEPAVQLLQAGPRPWLPQQRLLPRAELLCS